MKYLWATTCSSLLFYFPGLWDSILYYGTYTDSCPTPSMQPRTSRNSWHECTNVLGLKALITRMGILLGLKRQNLKLEERCVQLMTSQCLLTMEKDFCLVISMNARGSKMKEQLGYVWLLMTCILNKRGK